MLDGATMQTDSNDACSNLVAYFLPVTSTWPHLRCDVGRGISRQLSLYYSVVYYYNGALRYEQFLQVGRLYQALILLGLALCLPSASLSSVFMVLFAYIVLLTF